MAEYKILIRPSVTKDFKSIPQKDQKKILAKIESLANDPRPPSSIKLSGDERYRIRQGNYRILYEIQDDILIVTIVKVAHRKDVYKKRKS